MGHTAFIICGPAGAGKTTYAEKLAAERGAVLADIDVVTERLVRLVMKQSGLPETDRDSPTYKTLLREPVYETLFDVAKHNLPHQDCIIVGPFTRECRDPNGHNTSSATWGTPSRFTLSPVPTTFAVGASNSAATPGTRTNWPTGTPTPKPRASCPQRSLTNTSTRAPEHQAQT